MTLDARHNGQRITCEVQVSDPVMSETVIANLNVLCESMILLLSKEVTRERKRHVSVKLANQT